MSERRDNMPSRAAGSAAGQSIVPQELVLDIHTHTLASGHAYGTIREMAQGAAERGLKLLGISEHGPGTPGTCEPIYYNCMPYAPRNKYGVEIMYGCELNVHDDGTFRLAEKPLSRLDYAIVGIHGVCYHDQGRRKNTENLIACMRHPKVCLVSHPDDDHTPLDYPMLVAAAKELGVALEVNNNSLIKGDRRLNCVENYRQMLALCEQERVPIVVSSDAHDPDYVGRFDLACALLSEVGFDRDLIINLEVDRWKEHVRRRAERG